MTVQFLVQQLELQPHPEGGYYRESYRSEEVLAEEALSAGFTGERNVATAIYFLIEEGNFSALHRIRSDETWHFYYGDALEVVEISDDGGLKMTAVGKDLSTGEVFQYTVKANTWFGSRVKTGGRFSLVGCTVAPGFDFRDFEMADRKDLSKRFPHLKKEIEALTRI